MSETGTRAIVPTLKHWEITAWFMTLVKNLVTFRPCILEGKDWKTRVEVGKKALVACGVLKP